MTLGATDAWWGPCLFILLAGWIPTDVWRFLGVYFGGRIAEQSEILVFVRAVATALVAAVVGNLVVFPSGALAETALLLRISAAALGFATYLLLGRKVLAGILASEIVLGAGIWLGF